MSNNGFRLVVERRDNNYHWSFTQNGELFSGSRGFPSLVEAADDADTYRRQLKLADYWRKQREVRASQ